MLTLLPEGTLEHPDIQDSLKYSLFYSDLSKFCYLEIIELFSIFTMNGIKSVDNSSISTSIKSECAVWLSSAKLVDNALLSNFSGRLLVRMKT